MGKINVYLPDDLEREAREAGVSVSAVCQSALRNVLDTVAVLEGRSLRDPDPRVPGARITGRLLDILGDVEATAAKTGVPATAHDLLGAILESGDTVGARALRNLGVELPPSKRSTRRRVKGKAAFSADARERLVAAVHVALDMRHNYVGTEHLVIALSAEESPLHDLLAALGVDERALRAEVLRLLADPSRRVPKPARTAAPVDLVVRFEAELERLSQELGQLKERLDRD